MDRNELSLEPRYLGVPSGASKMITEPMVRSAQTVHLSYVKISTISKWTETSFHLILVNLEYHRLHPKWFLTLWYVWRKQCTYLALTLTPSWNWPNVIPHEPHHLGVPSSSSKTFPSLWYVWRNPGTYVALTLTPFPNGPKQDSPWPTSPSSSIRCVQNDF
jgi:hypothetical protein